MIQDYKSKEAIQYLAGLIDAEGHFKLRMTPKITSPLGGVFKIEMTSLECITFASKVLNSKKIYTQNRGINRKLIYSISIGKSENLLEVLNLLEPYINEKSRQLQIMKEYISLPLDIQRSQKLKYYELFINERYKFNGTIKCSYPYLAGIIDGDGIISITKQPKNNLYLAFALQQCFKEFPEYLYKTYGGSFQVRLAKKKEHRDSYIWYGKHKEIGEILDNCSEFLIEKYKKACLVKEVLNLKKEIDDFKIRRTNEILENYKN